MNNYSHCEFDTIRIEIKSFNTLSSNTINTELEIYKGELMNIYFKLANMIETVVNNDYSGCLDKKELKDNNQLTLEENPTRNDFYKSASAYLRLFKDRHLQLIDNSAKVFSNGFSVRRYEDHLVVTEVFQEIELEIGDVITHLNAIKIKDIESKYNSYFFSDDKNRQEWGVVIKQNQHLTYIRAGIAKSYELEKFPPVHIKPNYEFKYNHSVPIFAFTDFNNENAIENLVRENKNEILASDNLIIDVRHNAGGSDLSYFPLLPLIFDKPIHLSELNNETMSVMYSKRNCELRIEMLNNYLKSTENLPKEMIDYIENEIKLYRENYGKGFIAIEEDEAFDFLIKGGSKPKNIYILTDQYCGSSGDSFVKLAKLSPKVTIVGRNTMGVLDYSNVAFLELDDHFTLMYATSRMNYLDRGLGIDNIGITPDIYVEWTPEHLVEDLDIKKVFELIKDNK